MNKHRNLNSVLKGFNEVLTSDKCAVTYGNSVTFFWYGDAEYYAAARNKEAK